MSQVLANVPDVVDSTERACFVSSHFKASNRLRRFSNSDLRVGNSRQSTISLIHLEGYHCVRVDQRAVNGNTALYDAASIDLQTRQYDMNLRKVKTSIISTESTNEIYAKRHEIQTTPVPSYEETEGAEEPAETIAILLKAGGSCIAKSFNGDTPLQCAIKSQNVNAPEGRGE